MKATVLDTKTGKTHVHDGPRSWEWAENNWSCDCNRYPPDVESDDEEGEFCEGCKRFLVIAAEMGPDDYEYEIEQLNAGYPKELLAKHGLCHQPTRHTQKPTQSAL